MGGDFWDTNFREIIKIEAKQNMTMKSVNTDPFETRLPSIERPESQLFNDAKIIPNEYILMRFTVRF